MIFPYISFLKCSWNFIRLANVYKCIWEWIGTFIMYQEFPGGSDSKESSCNMGDLDLIPGLGRSPGGGHGSPLLSSCLENLQGQRSLAGYSPWDGKGSDITEWLSTRNILSNRVHQHVIPLFSLKWFLLVLLFNRFYHLNCINLSTSCISFSIMLIITSPNYIP